MFPIDPDSIGRIRITSMPWGDAPEEIRRMWIGIEIPCLWYKQHAEGVTPFSKRKVTGEPAYAVFQIHALEALAKVHPATAAWWYAKEFPESDEATWIFDAKSAEVVKEVLDYSVITGENN